MKTSRLFSVSKHGRQSGGAIAMQTTQRTHNVALLALKHPFIFPSRSGRISSLECYYVSLIAEASHNFSKYLEFLSQQDEKSHPHPSRLLVQELSHVHRYFEVNNTHNYSNSQKSLLKRSKQKFSMNFKTKIFVCVRWFYHKTYFIKLNIN